MKLHPGHERAVAFLAEHPLIEKSAYFVMGMAGFVVFVWPVLVGLGHMNNEGIALPFFGPEWMYWPNMALRLGVFICLPISMMALSYRFLKRNVEDQVKRVRLAIV